MAESRELGFTKPVIGLKEQLARTTLRNLRSQGHTYIELREDGKRFVFFCTLCLAPCYSDTILLGHLNGNLHKERFSCARITLLGQNPWPFNDGVLFFDCSTGEEEKPQITDGDCVTGPLQHCSDDERFAIVKYNGNGINGSNGDDHAAVDTDNEPSLCADSLLISGLLIKERTLDVEAKFIGFGRIAGRLFETKGRATWVDKLWCEWLGDEGHSDQEKATVPEHDFAIVTFSYFYNLGRLGLLEDPRPFLISNQPAESGNGEDNGRKRKKSFSDPEDTSDSLCSLYDSSEEDSSARNSRALITGYDDHLVNKRLIKNKTVRRELRKQQRIFSERICEVCKQKLLPGKDAAAILNTKTGNLACSSRNRLGAFHLFHVSCVIHWFLFCENEILGSKMMRGKGKGKGKKRCTKQSCGVKWNGLVGDVSWQIFSVFCPECQGTGINIEGDVIERDTFPLSQTWRFGVKVSEGRKAWVKNPEKLENCSTGFHFPRPDEESVKGQEERVQSMKLVRFYRVEL